MKLLNIGCGSVFSPSWTNVDMASSDPHVEVYDLRKGLPYGNSQFDGCYSSHVLEHFTSSEARTLVAECHRVLKPGGVVRVVVPDLESIATKYLEVLHNVESGASEQEANYDWLVLELYDQTVRTASGGNMMRYLCDPKLGNREFIRSRIGFEAERNWNGHQEPKAGLWEKIKKQVTEKGRFRTAVAKRLVSLLAGSEVRRAFDEGIFRNSGEVHKWMYDRFSLGRLLRSAGFKDTKVCRADESRIPEFNTYGLDVFEGKVRKPDSLFFEAIKP